MIIQKGKKERPVVDVLNFFIGNLDFPKIKKLNKVFSNMWNLNCENYAVFEQNYTLELFIALKIAVLV